MHVLSGSGLDTGREYNGTETDGAGYTYFIIISLGYSHAVFAGVGFLYFINTEVFLYSLFIHVPGFNFIGVKLLFACMEVFIYIQYWTSILTTTVVWFASLENFTLWNRNVR